MRPETRKIKNNTLTFTGNLEGFENLLPDTQTSVDLAALESALKSSPRHFAFVLETPQMIVAAVDKIRSIPVWYAPDRGLASLKVRDLRENSCGNLDHTSLLEFCMAGYVLGGNTLFADLKSLQAGEMLVIDKKTGRTETGHYYQYIPRPEKTADPALLQDQLESIIDRAMDRVIDQAAGRRIWLPLSGGLDSRLIAAKLVEKGYDNLASFSYGVAGNNEAQVAKQVADMLGLEWTMLAADKKRARSLYLSDMRKSYDSAIHGFVSAPGYVEFEAIHALFNRGMAQQGDMIVNGQSGDYIAGNHIPSFLYDNPDAGEDQLLEQILGKHFSMWKSLKTFENNATIIRHIQSLLPAIENADSDRERVICQYEAFEWTERQSKMVVHGQRCYEFFGLDWALPLWDGDLMHFFETVPLDLKFGRKLFRGYVESYNFKQAFDLPTAAIDVWRFPLSWIFRAAGLALKLTAGDQIKQHFYARMHYHGHAGNQLALFGKDEYHRYYKDMRNIYALASLHFCEDRSIAFPWPENKTGR